MESPEDSGRLDEKAGLGVGLVPGCAHGLAQRTSGTHQWFSISLAVDTDLPHFWASLEDDCHPPWVALMQRGLFAVFGTRAAFNLASVAAVAAGLVLLCRSFGRTLALRPLSLAVAGLHPVFFYYAGAVRWYPFVFLASALRISAMFAPAPGSKGARLRFLSGCLIGPMAGYADIAFAASDTMFYLVGSRSFTRRRSVGSGGSPLPRGSP